MSETIFFYNRNTNEELGSMTTDNPEPYEVKTMQEKFANANELDIEDVAIAGGGDDAPSKRLMISGMIYATAEPLEQEFTLDLSQDFNLSFKRSQGGVTLVTVDNDTIALETDSIQFQLIK